MSQQLNDAFINNPKSFLKRHLIVQNRLETVRPARTLPLDFLINFEYITQQPRHEDPPYLVKRLTRWRHKLKPMRSVQIQFCYLNANNPGGNFTPTPQNPGIRIYYVPYSGGTGHFRTLGQNADFVFTHTLSGCRILTSMPNTNPFNMLHLGGRASSDTRQRKITACFNGTAYREIGDQQYAETHIQGEDAENTNLIGIRNSRGNWNFYGQGYDTTYAIADKYKSEEGAAGMTHLCLFSAKKITNWMS